MPYAARTLIGAGVGVALARVGAVGLTPAVPPVLPPQPATIATEIATAVTRSAFTAPMCAPPIARAWARPPGATAQNYQTI